MKGLTVLALGGAWASDLGFGRGLGGAWALDLGFGRSLGFGSKGVIKYFDKGGFEGGLGTWCGFC